LTVTSGAESPDRTVLPSLSAIVPSRPSIGARIVV
jgi:hypothetical protein